MNLRKQRDVALTPEQLRSYEDRIKEMWERAEIRAPIHLAAGGEKALIEIFQYVHRDDWVFATWRSHHEALLHGIPEEVLTKDIRRGRSITIHNAEHRFFSSAIVNGTLPIAVGTAMALKRQGSQRSAWVFVGDMTAESGVFYEAVKYSLRNDLPIQFVIADNGLSTTTPTQESWGYVDAVPEVRRKFQVCRPPEDGAEGGWARLNGTSAEVFVHPDYEGKVLYYSYKRVFPHQGVGHRIAF